MKVFLKWTRNAFFFFGAIALIQIVINGIKPDRLGGLILTIITASTALGFLFYLLEEKYFPWRIPRLMKKIEKKYNAKRLTDTIAQFKSGSFDFYAVIHIQLRMSQIGSGEYIRFHIPRNQIDPLPVKPDFKYLESHCLDIETYLVYETNSTGLGIAKRRIARKLGQRS